MFGRSARASATSAIGQHAAAVIGADCRETGSIAPARPAGSRASALAQFRCAIAFCAGCDPHRIAECAFQGQTKGGAPVRRRAHRRAPWRAAFPTCRPSCADRGPFLGAASNRPIRRSAVSSENSCGDGFDHLADDAELRLGRRRLRRCRCRWSPRSLPSGPRPFRRWRSDPC